MVFVKVGDDSEERGENESRQGGVQEFDIGDLSVGEALVVPVRIQEGQLRENDVVCVGVGPKSDVTFSFTASQLILPS